MAEKLNMLGQTLISAGPGAKLDDTIKRILSEKSILARGYCRKIQRITPDRYRACCNHTIAEG